MSRIEKAYLEGDQHRYQVPCLHGRHMAPIEWKNIRWPEGKRNEAYLVCEECGGIMQEHNKPRLLAKGQWKATAEGDGRTASFHLSALYSPFLTWAEVAIEHGAARNDPPRMQAWQNLMLGEPYEDVAAQPLAVGWLTARVESYDHAPQGVSVVGLDVQDDRIELELVGFGVGDESWSLDYRVLYGDPSGKELWEELDALLRERVPHESGRQLRIRAACIDSGGHYPVAVYNFVRDKQGRSIWACKGASRHSMPPWPPRRPVRVGRNRVTPLYLIGVDSLKDALVARLRIEEPGVGYCHFPVGRGLDYYAGLTSERPVRKYHKGAARRVWTRIQGVRNEPLDCRILAMAPLEGLKASGLRLARISDAGHKPARRLSMAEWSAVFNG